MLTHRVLNLRKVILQAALLLGTLVVFDVLFWFLVPDHIAKIFYRYGYRAGTETGAFGGRQTYPKDYFSAHPTRGFDIRPGMRGVHRVEGQRFPVWSNRFGCFDRERLTIPRNYYYFAGDSYTWGYAPFEDRFVNRFEARTGRPSLNCGVTHTGTRHQFDKFQEILKQIGHAPGRVVVGYYPNDIANDYFHPHSTVIEGWLVDEVFVGAHNRKVSVDRTHIKNVVARKIVDATPRTALGRGFQWAIGQVRHYSILACMANETRKAIASLVSNDNAAAPRGALPVYHGEQIREVYVLDQATYGAGRLGYGDSKLSAPNMLALERWRNHSEAENYQLTLLLIPPVQQYNSVEFFAELRAFLTRSKIDFVDLAEEFHQRKLSKDQLFWAHDPHLSPGGHHIVADILAHRLVGH